MKLTRLLGSFAFFVLTSTLQATALTRQHADSADRAPDGVSKSDWAGIRAAYEAGRHAFQQTDKGWQARNPGQQWLTTFDRRGFVAQPDAAAWQWGLELKSYGFGAQQRAIGGTPTVTTEGQRLSYQWDAALQEWFVNDQRGLEHGFILSERPEGNTHSPLAFTLDVRGGLQPVLTPDALGVTFRDDHGHTVINYTGLKVWDADGKTLPSYFETNGADASVRLMVNESGARYPITIDPIAQQAYLKASNTEANDRFSASIAVSGDTVVVGAPYEASSATGVNGNQADNSANGSGAVYVFVRSEGTWTQQAYLKASNTEANDNFGNWVAVSGDTIVVGAPYEDSNATGVNGNESDNSAFSSGAAYVFLRNGATWTQQAYLKASNTQTGDSFGVSVAVAGDTVVVGASNESSNATGMNGNQADNSAGSSGAAYVFQRSGNTWSQQAYLKASNAGSLDRFGYRLAMSGETIAVGAYGEASIASGVNAYQADNTASNAGAVYIFVRDGATWAQEAYLKASNPAANDYFGLALAVSGDTVVVGAEGESSNATGINGNQADDSASMSGAAYVFARNGATWTQQAYLKASNTQSYTRFGISVGVSGEAVVVGASGEASGATGINGNQADTSVNGAGAAYVFLRSGTTWTQQVYLKASNTGAYDQFGRSCAVSGGTVVVGAEFESSNATGVNGTQTDNSASSAGAAYVFTITIPPTISSVSPVSGTPLGGTSVTITGTSFTGATNVTFGGNAASFTIDSDTSITATTPAGTLGPASVIVTTQGGTNPANSLFTYVQPDIAVSQSGALTDSAGSVSFLTKTLGSGPTLTFTISNPGTAPLTGLVVNKDGTDAADFTVSALSGTSIPVGAGTVTFTVTFAPTTTGAKAAALHIDSNVNGSKNPFDIALSGWTLSYSQDTDNDGLNDASEFDMVTLGFDWQVDQTALVSTLFNNANGAGLYNLSQVQALNVGVPLLTKNPTTGKFKLTISVQKAPNSELTEPFADFPMTGPDTTINGAGKLEFEFPSTDNAAFFRLQSQ